jgi:hypothetical protein
LVRQFWKAFDVYKQAPGNYHSAKLGNDSARSVGVMGASYKELVRLAVILGLPKPPRYRTKRMQNDAADLYPWRDAVDDWRIEAEVLLAHSPRPEPVFRDWPKHDTKFDEENVPAEFREGGERDGAPLTGPYLAKSSDWDFRPPYLSGHYWPGKLLTHRIKVGHAGVYAYTELLALRKHRNRKGKARDRREQQKVHQAQRS